jgi:hypothetical protein
MPPGALSAGGSAFSFRRKKPNYSSTSLGCWSIWKREG